MNSGTQKLKDAWTLLNQPYVITSRDVLPEMTEWAEEQGLSGFCALAAEDLSAHEMDTDCHHPRRRFGDAAFDLGKHGHAESRDAQP